MIRTRWIFRKVPNDVMRGHISPLLDDIAIHSEATPGVTRLPFTPQHEAASNIIKDWMRDAGLSVSMDDAGTIVGRREGPPEAPTLLFGSHQDSVRNGGKFDGIMGVLLPILALRTLETQALPFAVEVLAFADEEGVRFPTALLGSRALAGTLDPDILNVRDQDGISLGEAMHNFGLNPDALQNLDRRNSLLVGYVETHIEQGPVLENMQQALGVVSAISGIERYQITLIGQAGHAGTVPMESRQDALACAAEIILATEALAEEMSGLIVTVGKLDVVPNAVNVIPGHVSLTVEVRAANDKVRQRGAMALITKMDEITTKREIGFRWAKAYEQAATPCDESLRDTMKDAVQAAQGRALLIPSGATHDASAMADLCPIAMLCVRCRKGLSHSPDEFASEADMQLAIDALVKFTLKMSAKLIRQAQSV